MVVIAISAQGILMIPFRRQGPMLPETNHTLRPRRKNSLIINLFSFFRYEENSFESGTGL
jgi:hypothetical protein